jgi:hypothetical protein
MNIETITPHTVPEDATLAGPDIQPGAGEPKAIPPNEMRIGDRRFWKQLRDARELKAFLFSESVVFKDVDLELIHLGELERISFSRGGRIATVEEWKQIDSKRNKLLQYLSFGLRRKRRLAALSPYFRTLPLMLLVLAASALMLDSSVRFLPAKGDGSATWLFTSLDFLATLLWVFALGGLGTCGYLGTTLMAENRRLMANVIRMSDQTRDPAGSDNALSATTANIDLADVNMITTRIVVGILFAFIFGVPVYQFKVSLHDVIMGRGLKSDLPSDFIEYLVYWWLPFIIGFSTSLVLGVMERLVASVGTLFGLTPRS